MSISRVFVNRKYGRRVCSHYLNHLVISTRNEKITLVISHVLRIGSSLNLTTLKVTRKVGVSPTYKSL